VKETADRIAATIGHRPTSRIGSQQRLENET